MRGGIDLVFKWQSLKVFNAVELQHMLWSDIEWDVLSLGQIVLPGPSWPDGRQQVIWLRELLLAMAKHERRGEGHATAARALQNQLETVLLQNHGADVARCKITARMHRIFRDSFLPGGASLPLARASMHPPGGFSRYDSKNELDSLGPPAAAKAKAAHTHQQPRAVLSYTPAASGHFPLLGPFSTFLFPTLPTHARVWAVVLISIPFPSCSFRAICDGLGLQAHPREPNHHPAPGRSILLLLLLVILVRSQGRWRDG